MDPSNPNKIIAAMWQFRRRPWELKSGGPGRGLYITSDGGKNWKKFGKRMAFPQIPSVVSALLLRAACLLGSMQRSKPLKTDCIKVMMADLVGSSSIAMRRK
jgi:hypothetical protein